MNPEINRILQKTLLELPKELRAVIYSDEFAHALSTITEGHPLQEHQRVASENEVLLVILGLESPGSLVTNIRHRAQISRDRAEKIVKVANENILFPHQEILGAAFLNRDKEIGSRESERIIPAGSSGENKNRPHHEYAVDPYHEPIG